VGGRAAHDPSSYDDADTADFTEQRK
jgi:hypothetical protein